MDKQTKPYFVVQTADRAFTIFNVFIKERRPLGVVEIAQEMKLHKSIVHRLLLTMEMHELLEQVPETGKYRIGPKAFELGSVYMNTTLISEGKRFLPELAEKVGGSSHMAILNQGTVFYLINQESPKSKRMQAPVGVRNPVSTTALGKVLTAWLDEATVAELLRLQGMPMRTPKSLQSPEAYMRQLEQVRQRGYAVDDEEQMLGHRCVAVPVRDYTGKVIAAVSVGGTSRVITPDNAEELADVVRSYADAISGAMGYVDKQFGG